MDDEVMHSLSFNDWQASNGQPTGPAYTNYNKPSAAPKPGLVPTQQIVPSAPEVERGGESRHWGLENLNEPLTFPLRPIYRPSDPGNPQPGPIQSQTSLNVDYSNGMNASPSTGGASRTGSPNAEPAPSYNSQGENSPRLNTWQPEPVNGGYGAAGSLTQDSNTGSRTRERSTRKEPHRIFEDVFQYPSENTESSPRYDNIFNNAGGSSQASYVSKGSSTEYSSEPSLPSYPANAGGPHVLPPGKGSSVFGQTSYQPHNEKTPALGPQKTVIHTQRVREPSRPPPPPPPPSTYIIQSRNGYKRARKLLNKSRYSKEFFLPMPVSSMAVKGLERVNQLPPRTKG